MAVNVLAGDGSLLQRIAVPAEACSTFCYKVMEVNSLGVHVGKRGNRESGQGTSESYSPITRRTLLPVPEKKIGTHP